VTDLVGDYPVQIIRIDSVHRPSLEHNAEKPAGKSESKKYGTLLQVW
jgi:hypothetical protein